MSRTLSTIERATHDELIALVDHRVLLGIVQFPAGVDHILFALGENGYRIRQTLKPRGQQTVFPHWKSRYFSLLNL